MFTINKLSKTYGINYLFKDSKIVIKENGKYGLVGKNGSGKTTLFKIINNEIDFEGHMEKHSLSICKFDQIEKIQGTVRDYLIDYSNYDFEVENHCAKLLDEFNLNFEMELSEMSGGQKAIIRLIKVLSTKCDLLLLDEPTNHLDMKNIEKLKNYLFNFNGAYIVISHDRIFLSEVSDSILEIESEKISTYECSYSEYLKRKEKIKHDLEMINKKNSEKKARLENLKKLETQHVKGINKNLNTLKDKYGPNKSQICDARQKAEKAQRRIGKALNSLDLGISKINLEKPIVDDSRIRIELFSIKKSDNEVVKLEKVEKSFGSKKIISSLDLEINRGEKVFIIGDNGSGKTTLINSILSDSFDSGHISVGSNVVFGLVDQEKHDLVQDIKLLDYFKKLFPNIQSGQIRNYLAAFLFRKNDVHKLLSNLSGGELMRVSFLECLLKGANVIIFDEPTNNLDLESIKVLEAAIKEFEGTIITITHDRALASNCASVMYKLKNKKLEVVL